MRVPLYPMQCITYMSWLKVTFQSMVLYVLKCLLTQSLQTLLFFLYSKNLSNSLQDL